MKIFVLLAIILNLITSSPDFPQFDIPQHHGHPRYQQSIDQHINNFEELLETLAPDALEYFVRIYHSNHDEFVSAKLAQAQNGAYFFYVGKMYIYGLLQNPLQDELKHYKTEARYLAAYFYLKVAAQRYGNRQAYYFIGLLQQFKLVPDKIIQGNLQKISRDKNQQFLYKYLKTSHLNNGEHMLFMAAALEYDPASLVLAHMNREPFGTTYNCTTSLAYYLAVLKRALFQPYVPKLAFEVHDSLEDQLFAMKKLQTEQQIKNHQFVVETTYFDEETISATLQQANRFYTGSGGVMRDLTRALNLYQKLSLQGNNDGKVMAGLLYFRGEGATRNVYKARALFQQSAKDEVSEYMLLAMDYFEITGVKTREKAILAMKNKFSNKKKLTHLMGYLIGSVALKGEIKEISYDQAIQMIDRSAAEGNPSSRILMAILFADGAKGLKYGCPEATKYLSQDASSFPYFRRQVNSGQFAIKRGLYSFAFFKYLQLSFNNYKTGFINLLYLIENYKDEALNLNQNSWLPSKLAESVAYKKLRKFNYVPQVYSYLSSQYSPIGLNSLKVGQLQNLLTADQKIIKGQLMYMMRKIIKRGVLYQSKGVLKYYQYKLLVEEGSDQSTLQQVLSSLASGDSSKLYVSEARYLLGRLYHQRFLKNKTILVEKEEVRVLGEYNRAVKSQILGKIIYEVQHYRITGQLGFDFAQSEMGEDLLAYIFVLAIVIFVLYYMRSKRFDHFHRMQLERQLKKAQQEQAQVAEENQPNLPTQQINRHQEQQQQDSRNQPVITEDTSEQALRPPEKGIRIGSSQEEDSI